MDLSEKLSFDESTLFEVNNREDRAKIAAVCRRIYLQRENYDLLGTVFQQDESGTMWILINFFKGPVCFSFREQDTIRALCGNTFGDIEVFVTAFETEAEREECGTPFMTQVVVKLVKQEVITSGLIYESAAGKTA